MQHARFIKCTLQFTFCTVVSKKSLLPLKWDNSSEQCMERGEDVQLRQCKKDSQGRVSTNAEEHHRITKLYFSPYQYPPPANDIEHNIVCIHLRNYIQKAAEAGQSPVVCTGDSARQKRFRCGHWYRRKAQPKSEKSAQWHPYSMHSCTFTFVIRWDKFGYYIPLLENLYQHYNMGCAWHCCIEK